MEPRKAVTITKQELSQLPMMNYTGEIVLVDSEEDAGKAAEILRKESIIGFDTETKPSFKRGQTNKVSLLQLSSHSVCYLFRLNHIGLPAPVKSLLEDDSVKKIGVSIHDDFHSLRKLFDLNPAGFIDLQSYVKEYGILDNSLARIFGILFDKRISKGQRLTNWEADELTDHQQAYAALDALACIKIYDYLSQGNFFPDNSPYFREIDENGKPMSVESDSHASDSPSISGL